MKRDSCIARLRSTAFLAGLSLFVSYPIAATREFSEWSTPVSLGPVVNSEFVEFLPAISTRGLSLYLTTNRPGGFGGDDIWVSRRERRGGPWGPPINLGLKINTGFAESAPALSRDGHWLFFATNRPGGAGGNDIWVSWRAHTRDDFGWQPPVNLGGGMNSAFNDFVGSYVENDKIGFPHLYFISNRPGGVGGLDIYVSALTDNGSFGPAVLVPELSSLENDFRPAIRRDGLEALINSNRPGPGPIGNSDLWISARATVSGSWSTPANLGATVNSQFTDGFPALSADGETLFFASNRPGGIAGSLDLYMSSRSKLDDDDEDDDDDDDGDDR